LAAPDSDPDDPAHTFLFEIDDGRVIDARFRGNAARWINHSCAPNCVTHEDDGGHVFIEAKRRIRPGEELTYDYRLSVEGRLTRKERAQYTCRCGTANCRGTVLVRPRRPREMRRDAARQAGLAAANDGHSRRRRARR